MPASIDYTKILPVAAGNPRALRRSYFPINGQSFTAIGNNILRIEIAASQLWDPLHSFLRFNVTLPGTAGVTFGLDNGGGHSFIRRLRLEQSGSVLMDTQRYDRLLSAILLPCQGGAESVAHRSLTEQVRYNNTGTAGVNYDQVLQNGVITGACMLGQCNQDSQMAVDAVFQVCIPLVGGLFSQSKLVPLQLLGSAPLTIEIELNTPGDVGVVATGQNVPLADYTISDVRYIASLVEVSPEVDAQVRMVQEMSGGQLVINGTDYTHFNGNIPANATGNQAINIPARRKSLKSLLWVGGSLAFGAAAAATAQNRLYNLHYGGHLNLVDYFVKIGSMTHPATPVLCNFNGGNRVNVRGEAIMELSKCFGTTGSVVGLGLLSASNTYNTTGVVAGMALTNQVPRYAPFGLDLEAFQRTAIESGVNTADKSTPITLVLNVGTAMAEQIALDCYVSFDSLYFIDSSGVISVSQ